ncbi:MAG: H-NS family nucleoid-associated regulatory protein [Hyphomicrobiaceae bacterium]
MARAPAVEKMTLKEIEALEARIADAKAAAAEEAKAEVKAKIDAILDRSGLTIADLYPTARRAKGRSKSTVKYRNPKDSSQTWSGRGRKPNWLVDAVKKGAKLESFAV